MSKNWSRPRDRGGRFCRPGDEGREPARASSRPCRSAKGWPKAKEAIFFRELGIVCDPRLALKAAGLVRRSSEVQERLKTDPGFAAQWNSALDASSALLELEMHGRVRFGDNRPEPATAAEKKLREVPSSVALQLLKHCHARRKGQGAGSAAPPPKPRLDARELRKRLDAKLSEFNLLMGGEG